ncbi:MAG: hypothetical protein JW753_03540 [Dehalococcoidia bacterium]|nr:hypothetical protein [Dehalococcoidia bacterium]
MPEVRFITHKGVQILYENFENARLDEIVPWIEKTKAIIRSQPRKSVLGLVNVKGASFDLSVTSALKEFVKGNEPYMICAAVYGVEGLKEVIFSSVLTFSRRKNLVLCKTLEEGKDYLVRQAEKQRPAP